MRGLVSAFARVLVIVAAAALVGMRPTARRTSSPAQASAKIPPPEWARGAPPQAPPGSPRPDSLPALLRDLLLIAALFPA